MMKITIIIIAILSITLILLLGCAKEPIVGGDKDEHGCIGSAGYTWCEAKQKCLRTWEEPCEVATEPEACTEDARVCPDGTTLVRDLENNCEFPECPEPEEPIGCPEDAKTCPGGTVLVRDPENDCKFPECPEEKEYKQTDPVICKYIELRCPEGQKPFFDEKGCGCVPGEPEPKKYFCLREQDADQYVCTLQYEPVCGWADIDKIRCIKYPCASTYGNQCQACADENVEYWTEGECPE